MEADWVKEFKKREVVAQPITENMQRKMNGSAPSAKANTRNPVHPKR